MIIMADDEEYETIGLGHSYYQCHYGNPILQSQTETIKKYQLWITGFDTQYELFN